MYPIIRNGKITGTTSMPNETSSVPIDKDSKEWKDYEKEQADKRSKRLEYSGISMNKILDELEYRFPGFIDAVKNR